MAAFNIVSFLHIIYPKTLSNGLLWNLHNLQDESIRHNYNVWFQKNIHTHHKDGHWKFRGEGGFQKPNFLRESMKQNWKFQGGWKGRSPKSHPWGRYGYCLGRHNIIIPLYQFENQTDPPFASCFHPEPTHSKAKINHR